MECLVRAPCRRLLSSRSPSPWNALRCLRSPSAVNGHEIKLDGYRCQAVHTLHGLQLFSRNGKDLSRKFPRLLPELTRGIPLSAVVDGELCALDEQGRPSFNLLQNYSGITPPHLVFYAFDLLAIDGESLLQHTLRKRRERLARTLIEGAHLQLSGDSDSLEAMLRLRLPCSADDLLTQGSEAGRYSAEAVFLAAFFGAVFFAEPFGRPRRSAGASTAAPPAINSRACCHCAICASIVARISSVCIDASCPAYLLRNVLDPFSMRVNIFNGYVIDFQPSADRLRIYPKPSSEARATPRRRLRKPGPGWQTAEFRLFHPEPGWKKEGKAPVLHWGPVIQERPCFVPNLTGSSCRALYKSPDRAGNSSSFRRALPALGWKLRY